MRSGGGDFNAQNMRCLLLWERDGQGDFIEHCRRVLNIDDEVIDEKVVADALDDFLDLLIFKRVQLIYHHLPKNEVTVLDGAVNEKWEASKRIDLLDRFLCSIFIELLLVIW